MRKTFAALAASLLILTLAACVPVSGGSQPDKAEPAAEASDTITEPSFAPEPEPDPTQGNLAFGSAMTWADGLSVSISEPVPFTPSEYAAGGTQPHNVKFTVTVTNATDLNFDSYVYMTATSGGAAAEQVFDSTSGLGGPPSGTILPGQTISFEAGFNVADPAAIVLSVTPGFQYEDAIFTNVK